MLTLSFSRRAFVITAAVLGALTALHIYLWNVQAEELRARFDAWAQEEVKKGNTVKGESHITGFPFSVALNITGFEYNRVEVAQVTTPALTLSLRPWTPFRITASADAETAFIFPKMDTHLTIKKIQISIAQPLFSPHSTRNNGLFVGVTLNGIILDERQKMALGNMIETLSFRARVKGAPPSPEDKGEVEAWRKEGGTVEFDRMNAVWGSLNISGKGTLALDKDFQPEASFAATVYGYDQAVNVMRDQGQLKPLVASLIKAALKMLEEEEERRTGQATQTIKVPVTVQGNALSIAGVSILNWPPIDWP